MADIDRRREELERMVMLHEQRLERAMHNLKQAAQTGIRIAPYVAERPWQWVAGAFALGLWFGLRQH